MKIGGRAFWCLSLLLVLTGSIIMLSCEDDDNDPSSPSPNPTATPVPAACTGLAYGGVCWHLTAQNQSCNSLCGGFGGVNQNVLNFWANRTPQECHTLTTSLGANVYNGIGNGTDPNFNQNNCWHYGCAAEVGTRHRTYLCYQMPQDTSWTDEGTRLVCPCNN